MSNHDFDETINTNNLNATSTSFDVDSDSRIGLYVYSVSGVSTTSVITLQVQGSEGAGWLDTSHTITGAGSILNIPITADSVRVKVTTAQGALSTSKIVIAAN